MARQIKQEVLGSNRGMENLFQKKIVLSVDT